MVWLIMLGCVVAYIVGLVMLVKITPGLLRRAYDDALFIGVAAVAVLGAMLAFGAVGVVYMLFSGALAARVFDALLLVILAIVALRTSFGAFRPRYSFNSGTYRASRILAGSFFLALVAAAAVVLILLFQAS